MTWAVEADLLLGDIPLNNIDTGSYLDAAEAEINVQVGNYYAIPLPTLVGHQFSLMKLIHSRLASGRLIMAQAVGGESEDLHAYGQSLVEFAYERLFAVGTSIALTGASPVGVAGESRAPTTIHPDTLAVSPFETYTQYVHNHGTDFIDWG